MGLFAELKKRIPPMIFLLALLSAFPPLSTDMYLPALPMLQKSWRVELVDINFSLIIFFMTYCGSLLFYGPLSDRYGRRPPLLVGITIFVIACGVCATAQDATMMTVGRFLQGAGAAGASGLSMAICKDIFTGRTRQMVMVQIGMIVATAPMIAPIIGGWIIALLSWPWIFLLQGMLALVALLGVYFMEEPLVQRDNPPNFAEVASGYLRLFSNRRYMFLLMSFSFVGMPIFAFIGGSSDLYITHFGYDERQFGYFFGFNSLAFILAPYTFSRFARHYRATQLMPFAFIGMLCSALLFFLPWLPDPWRLTGPMFLLTFCFSFSRPGGNNLILNQVDRDTGSAASLMVFCYFMTGALAMWFFSFDWADKILVMGLLALVSTTLTLLSWLAIHKRLKEDI